jgi:molecular chaperone GrpE
MKESAEKNQTQEHMDQNTASNNTQENSVAQSDEINSSDMSRGQGDALRACQIELASIKNQYIRVRADLENVTRRMERERSNFVSLGQRAVLLDMLAIVDDFDRALRDYQPEELRAQRGGTSEFDMREPAASLEKEREQGTVEAIHEHEQAQDKKIWLAGFALIRASLYKVLEKYGVKPMTPQQYAHFDPHVHEAIMHIESAEHKSGEIVQVLLQGFMMGDQVLRPAQVSVAK